jgi:ferredoxin
MYAMTPQDIERGKCTNPNCIRCGRCIEVCPEEAIDLYWRRGSIQVRSVFITLAIAAGLAWYIWFVVLLVDFI